MIYVLYGDDDFSKRVFLDDLRRSVGSSELLQANTTVLAGAGLSPNHLQGVCSAVPFLAEHRLVVVEGLLGRFEEVRVDRRAGRATSAQEALEEWRGAVAALPQLPSSTLLVFLEIGLRGDNALLRTLSSVAQVKEFPTMGGEALERWVRQRVAAREGKIAPQAIRRLVDLVGGNLWILGQEIEKLTLYEGDGGVIDEEAVNLLVAHAREANIFRAVDAIFTGRSSTAMQLLQWLRQQGAEVSYIFAMLARQLRLILLAQELLAQRLPRAEMGRRLGLTMEFALRQTEEQARRYTYERVVEMYRALLEADLAVKQGVLEDVQALETLVAGLAKGAAVGQANPTRGGSR